MASGGSRGNRPSFDLDVVESGALFFRVDLHIHSAGGSSDVKDESMTPRAVLQTAAQRGIALVAITDHNSTASLPQAISDSVDFQQVSLVIGMEITTSDGHVLVLFPPEKLSALRRLEGKLDFHVDQQGDLYTHIRIDQVASLAAQFGGLAIPAHVDRPNTGFYRKATYHATEAIIQSPHVLALEIDDLAHRDWYSDADANGEAHARTAMYRSRKELLGPVVGARLSKVTFSDAHRLARIGVAPNGEETLTRVKMDKPSFEAFRTALLDPDARVRIEAGLPANYPRLVAARFSGGFLDGQQINFSSNLTSLIGGRGSGKSTALEAVRWACSAVTASAMERQANWPDVVDLAILDRFGQLHWVRRESGSSTGPVEHVDGEEVPFDFRIEGYEQDEIARIIRTYDKEPLRMLQFVDQFIDLSGVVAELTEIREELVINWEDEKSVLNAPIALREVRRQLAIVSGQIAAAAQSQAKDALHWRRILHSERTLRRAVVIRLGEIATKLAELDLSIDLDRLAVSVGFGDLTSMFAADLLVGSKQPTLQSLLIELDQALEESLASGQRTVESFRSKIDRVLAIWEQQDQAIQKQIDDVTAELHAKGVQLDYKALNELATKEASLKARSVQFASDVAQLNRLQAKRTEFLERYKTLQDRRFQVRVLRAKQLTQELRAAADFDVGVDFRRGEQCEDYEQWLRAALNRLFIRGDKIHRFCTQLHPIDLARAVRRSDIKTLTRVTDEAGSPFLATAQEAEQFVAHLAQKDLAALDATAAEDRPVLSLTVYREDKVIHVPFHNLSFGQKSTILLGLLLFSQATDPLVIDQPEDHLDSQFIYSTVVRTLRRIKERRQVVLSTHSANIAILGDAELIVPLMGWKDLGQVVDRGSVDSPSTKRRACNILEGGEAAYRRRGELYGIIPVGSGPAADTT